MEGPIKNIDNISAGSESTPKREGFWEREVRLFKSEVKGWPIFGSKSKKPSVAQKKSAKKADKSKKSAPNKKQEKARPKTIIILRNIVLAVLFSAGFLLIVSSTAVFAYKSSYKKRAFYGTKILGEEVGGKTPGEIHDIVTAKMEAVSFSFAVDGQNIAVKPADAGVTFNTDATTEKASGAGKAGAWWEPWVYSAESLFYKLSPKLAAQIEPKFKQNLAVDYAINDQKLADLTQNLSQSFNVQSQNAGLVMKGTDVQVIPAVYGRAILTTSIKSQIDAAVRSAQNSTIAIQVEKVNPDIVEGDTEKSIDQAKTILNIPVNYHYQGQNFTPDKATVGGWIVFNTQKVNGKDALVPSVDSKLVYSYIYSLAAKINVPAVNKKVTVTNGAQETVDQDGKDGLAVDVDSASFTTANTLSSGKKIDLELPTYVVKAKTTVNNVTVADWSKYVDVNISTQTMCAYLAGGDQQGCWPITTAATGLGHYTPTGTFLILRKVYVTSMPNPPSPYPLNNIHYVSYFTNEGHAIHEAWWRSSFGGDPTWNGSHGCVNASLSVAEWIYNWAPIGTPVIIHY